MNPLLDALRGCFHQAAETCRCPAGRLIHGFGLGDFLTNAVLPDDDTTTLVVRALRYFCEGARPADTRFQVTVLAVATFLATHHMRPAQTGVPLQAARDLVSILETYGPSEVQVRRWVQSHFGERISGGGG